MRVLWHSGTVNESIYYKSDDSEGTHRSSAAQPPLPLTPTRDHLKLYPSITRR